MTAPESLTPGDDHIPAAQRTTPKVGYDYPLVFDEAGTDEIEFPRDVKYSTFKAKGGNFLFNVSYTDGTNEEPGTLLSAGAGGLVKPLNDGDVYELPQEVEFNKVYVELLALSDGETEATFTAYPGAGHLNELVAE